MNGHDERAHFDLGQILQFVDDDGNRGATVCRCLADRDKQFSQIGLQIAAVCRACFGINVEAELGVACLDFDCADKTAKHSQTPLDLLADVLHSVQCKQGLAQWRRKQLGQRFVLVGFNQHCPVTLHFSNFTYAVEQHGFANTT